MVGLRWKVASAGAAVLVVIAGFGVMSRASSGGGSNRYSATLAGELETAKAKGAEEQVEALADGRVTPEEHLSATLAAVACTRDNGGAILDVRPEWSGAVTMFVYDSSTPDLARIAETCYSEHAENVDIAFQLSPEVENMRTSVYRELSECMEELGIDVSSHFSPRDAFAHPDQAHECLDRSRVPG